MRRKTKRRKGWGCRPAHLGQPTYHPAMHPARPRTPSPTSCDVTVTQLSLNASRSGARSPHHVLGPLALIYPASAPQTLALGSPPPLHAAAIFFPLSPPVFVTDEPPSPSLNLPPESRYGADLGGMIKRRPPPLLRRHPRHPSRACEGSRRSYFLLLQYRRF